MCSNSLESFEAFGGEDNYDHSRSWSSSGPRLLLMLGCEGPMIWPTPLPTGLTLTFRVSMHIDRNLVFGQPGDQESIGVQRLIFHSP